MEESTPPYPLEQLVAIKKRRLEAAEKALMEKKNLLAKEEDKLLSLEKQRDEVKAHQQDKLHQFREELDKGSTSDKIQQMRQYLKLVQERLNEEERKVGEQKKMVEQAEQQVELARQELFKKQKDIEKLSLHREEWSEGEKKIQTTREGAQTDEIGTILHTSKKQHSRGKNNTST